MVYEKIYELIRPKEVKKYFIVVNDKKEGPFSLNELIGKGYSADTLVWFKGLNKWEKLNNIKDYKRNIPPPISKINIAENKQLKSNKGSNKIIIKNTLDATVLKSQDTNLIQKRIMVQHSGFWLRLIAFFIDHVFTFSLWSCIWLAFEFPKPFDAKSFSIGNTEIISSSILVFLAWLYYSIFESSRLQASIGKIITELKVTDTNYSKITFTTASVRYFSKLLSFLFLGFGFLMVVFRKDKQGLHDKIAETYVVKSNDYKKTSKIIAWFILFIIIIAFIILAI